MWLETSLVFFPTRYPDGDWDDRPNGAEDVWFDTADGVRLHAWFVPCERPVAVLLFAHGNAGNLSDRAFLLERLRRLGAAVMIFDYRGYGRSEGTPSEKGVYLDVRAAAEALARRAGVRRSDLVLLGRSLGGAAVVDLAAEEAVRGLVLESTFTSLTDVAAYHFPWLPVRHMMRMRFDTASKIGSCRCPLLQSHGTADTIVPFSLGRQLFELANDPKRFLTFDGLDHNDPPPRWYDAELLNFLRSVSPSHA